MAPIRSSKFRHVFGDPNRKEKCHDNIRLTKNAFDSNLAKSNGKYVSLNWEASGGGSFAVIPTHEEGKLPDRFPLFDGHKGAVLDTDWNPFNDDIVVSASDDGTIGVWEVPKDFSVYVEYGDLDDCPDVKPLKFLKGHSKKVGHVGFNPVAENILASSSLDNTIKVWDIESGEVLYTLPHPAMVTSFSWNYDGTKLATVAKDRKLRIWDVRNEKILSEGKGHHGAKGSRVVWLGDNDRVLTTGFSLISDREMALWDVNDIPKGPIGDFRRLDPSSGIVIPHYDPMTSIVYLGGRGDGKIVYYQFEDDNLYDLFAYNSTSPQRGLGWVPNRSLDPHKFEVAKAYKVHEHMIEPISFKIPLKGVDMLSDVYTFQESTTPAMSAAEFKEGKTSRPLVNDWRGVYENQKTEPIVAPTKQGKQEATPAEPKVSQSTEHESKVPETASKQAAVEIDEKKTDSKSVLPEKSPKVELEEKKLPEPSTSSEEIAALEKAENQDSNKVLHSDGVKDFLAKNSESGADEEQRDESDHNSIWDSEEEVSKPKHSPQPVASNDISETKVSSASPEDVKESTAVSTEKTTTTTTLSNDASSEGEKDQVNTDKATIAALVNTVELLTKRIEILEAGQKA